MKTRIEELEAENAILRDVVVSIWWMARRYAEGRATYATSMFNAAIKRVLALGIDLKMTDGTLYARDEWGRPYDHLTDEEAQEHQP